MSIYILIEYVENYCRNNGEIPSIGGLKRYKQSYWR